MTSDAVERRSQRVILKDNKSESESCHTAKKQSVISRCRRETDCEDEENPFSFAFPRLLPRAGFERSWNLWQHLADADRVALPNDLVGGTFRLSRLPKPWSGGWKRLLCNIAYTVCCLLNYYILIWARLLSTAPGRVCLSTGRPGGQTLMFGKLRRIEAATDHSFCFWGINATTMAQCT